jgi:phage shock protein PspC (stress-responsive transcriptional regulator)
MTQPTFTQPPYRQLRRPTTDRIIAGVASGIGRYANVDPTVIRVIFAVAVIATGGLALLTYPVLWFLIPQEPADAPAWPHPAPAHSPVWPPNAPGGSPGPAPAPPAAPADPSPAGPPPAG